MPKSKSAGATKARPSPERRELEAAGRILLQMRAPASELLAAIERFVEAYGKVRP